MTAGRKVSLRFINDGTEACSFIATPNAYRSKVKTIRVAAGGTRTRSWPLSRKHRWYDFTITCDSAPGFARRFAGRAENGKHDVTDPAMGS